MTLFGPVRIRKGHDTPSVAKALTVAWAEPVRAKGGEEVADRLPHAGVGVEHHL